MKLYGLLGANKSITELFKEISIKHLQMETIGWVVVSLLSYRGETEIPHHQIGFVLLVEILQKQKPLLRIPWIFSCYYRGTLLWLIPSYLLIQPHLKKVPWLLRWPHFRGWIYPDIGTFLSGLISGIKILERVHYICYRYIPMRYIQSMGTFGFANQLYKSTLRFYYGASKEVSRSILSTGLWFTFSFCSFQNTSYKLTGMVHSRRFVLHLLSILVVQMLVSAHCLSP